MDTEKWKRLWDSLRITYSQNFPPVKKPTVQALDEFEATTGFRLPASYRAFIVVFGPGEIGCTFRLSAPGYAAYGSYADLSMLNQMFFKDLEPGSDDEKYYRDVDRIRRLFFFSATDGGEPIGWDPADVRDPENREYGIYILPDGSRAPKEIAASFGEFVETVCLGTRYNQLFSDPNSGIPASERQVFIPKGDVPTTE